MAPKRKGSGELEENIKDPKKEIYVSGYKYVLAQEDPPFKTPAQ
jgi:hypothetical protein